MKCWSSSLQIRDTLQALFRKIAAALPGMESVAQKKPEQLEEVKLTPTTVSLEAKAPAQASTCSC